MRVVRLARVLRGGSCEAEPEREEPLSSDIHKRLSEEVIRSNPELFRGPTAESNWVIPHRLLVGAYPIEYTQEGGVKRKEDPILRSLLSQGVTTFVCLQKEYLHSYTRLGSTYHPYILDAWDLCKEAEDLPDSSKIRLLHLPIEDCACGEDKTVLQLCVHLSYTIVLRKDEVVYIHCWGGHGRTGTMVAIIIGLLYDLRSTEALKLTQMLHDLRESDSKVPSPQTDIQRQQVIAILGSKQACKVKRNLRVLQERLRSEEGPCRQVSQQLSVFDLCVRPEEFNRKETFTVQPTRTKTVQNHQRFFTLTRRIKQHARSITQPDAQVSRDLKLVNSPRPWSKPWRTFSMMPARPKGPAGSRRIQLSPRAASQQHATRISPRNPG